MGVRHTEDDIGSKQEQNTVASKLPTSLPRNAPIAPRVVKQIQSR